MSTIEKAVHLWVEKLLPSLESNLEKLYEGGKAERFFHPKMHGCLRAEFIVRDDLTPDLQKGVFSQAKTYPTWIRFSNSSHRSKSDTRNNYHGMAIKLMDVAGIKLLEGYENAETQDFIMVNSEVLNAKSLQNVGKAVLAANGNIFVKIWFLITHLIELIKTLKKTPYLNLLHSQYFSQVPISFGENSAIKFTAIPRDTDDPDIYNHNDPDYLRKQMMAELSEKDIWFDFAVQFQADPESMPLEDPSVKWTSPFIKVASIRIPQQEFYNTAQSLFGEHLSFNPWHSIEAHKPLGKINTARKDIYKIMSLFRHKKNGLKMFEPTSQMTPEVIFSKEVISSEIPDLFPMDRKIYQSQFTAIIPVKNKHYEVLDEKLKKLGATIGETNDSIFSRLRTCHYCRFFLIDSAKYPNGDALPVQLVFSGVFDGPLKHFLNDLFEELGKVMDEICIHCVDYPENGSREEKSKWIHSFRNKEKLFWPAKKGGTVSMILKESLLQKNIQEFLDLTYKNEDLSKEKPASVYSKIIDHVKSQPDLKWALKPEPQANFLTKVYNIIRGLSVVLMLLILLVPILIIWLPLILYFNKRDSKNVRKAPEKPLKDVLAMEDKFYQNQLTIYATIKKPGWFRITNLKLFLLIANNSMRYRATKGSLAGITSIHFVSWSIFNNSMNGMFLSNYDNGWQSYLSEFIDQAASVMNLSFGNLMGYPAIRGLSKDGAHDEQKFKEIVRQYQYPCRVWYSAYPQISVSNVISNSKIRQGLSRKMSDAAIREWLQLF